MNKITFVCPDCGNTVLGAVEQVFLTVPVISIFENGNINYDYNSQTTGDGHLLCYKCLFCGYELQDEDGNNITDCLKIVEWIKKHCPEN
jgi:rubredoxin